MFRNSLQGYLFSGMDFKHVAADESKEFYTAERCHILELMNIADNHRQSIARARVEKSVTTVWHRLIDTSECLYFLSGEGIVEIGDDYSENIRPGELVYVPPSTPQRVINTGESDLVFLCLCVPAYNEQCYESLEKT